MKIIDETHKIYLINNHISTIPIFWEAEEAQISIKQIDIGGKIVNRWQDLEPDRLTYWGLTCIYGSYGFFPQTGQMNLNGTCVKLGERDKNDDSGVSVKSFEGFIDYRRGVIADSDGSQQTLYSEISFGHHHILVKLHPNFEVIYSSTLASS